MKLNNEIKIVERINETYIKALKHYEIVNAFSNINEVSNDEYFVIYVLINDIIDIFKYLHMNNYIEDAETDEFKTSISEFNCPLIKNYLNENNK